MTPAAHHLVANSWPASSSFAVTKLRLRQFRNYETLDLNLAQKIIVLTGANGAGKTNLLEAVSLLAPGRGLRRATLSDMDRSDGGAWSIQAIIEGGEDVLDIETGRSDQTERRYLNLFGQAAASQHELAQLVSLVWLTPAMDRVLAEGAGDRRRFLDRLVLAIYPDHARQVTSYEKAMRERSSALRSGRHDSIWLDALERRMAEPALAIAAARRELITGLNEVLRTSSLPMPRVELAIDGDVENDLATLPAVEAEQEFAARLASGRARDTQIGGAGFGPHRSEFSARDGENGEPAARCSTGRQKVMLLAIVLGEARLRQLRHGNLPIILLDEVAAHLDMCRHRELCEALSEVGAQTWLTSTDASLFNDLAGRAQFFHVD